MLQAQPANPWTYGRPTRLIRAAASVAVVALAAGCTQGAEQQAEAPAEPVVATTTTTESVLPPATGLPRADETNGLVEIVLPPSMIVSDGGTIREIRGDEAHVLARVSPLEPGADPADGERFGLIDVGGARSVVAELRQGESTTIVRFEADSSRIVFGPGAQPATDNDGRLVAYVRGDQLVLASGSAEELSAAPLSSPVIDVAMRPDGTAVAVLSDTGLDIYPITQSEFGTPQPVGLVGSATAVAWRDTHTLTVALVDSEGGMVAVLGADGRAVDQTRVYADVADLDWSSDGSIAAVTTADGEVRWVKQGAWAPIDTPAAEATRW